VQLPSLAAASLIVKAPSAERRPRPQRRSHSANHLPALDAPAASTRPASKFYQSGAQLTASEGFVQRIVVEAVHPRGRFGVRKMHLRLRRRQKPSSAVMTRPSPVADPFQRRRRKKEVMGDAQRNGNRPVWPGCSVTRRVLDGLYHPAAAFGTARPVAQLCARTKCAQERGLRTITSCVQRHRTCDKAKRRERWPGVQEGRRLGPSSLASRSRRRGNAS